jgi:hypothetical protein
MASAPDVHPAITEKNVDSPPGIAMLMDDASARVVAAWLSHHRGAPEARTVQEAMWLRAVFLKAEVGLSQYERASFRRRADRILGHVLSAGGLSKWHAG